MASTTDTQSGQVSESQDTDNAAIPENGVVAGGEGDQQPAQPQPNMWQMVKGMAFRMFIIYMIMSFFRGRSSSTPADTPAGEPGQIATRPGTNLFSTGTLMDLRVYVSEEEIFTEFNNSQFLFWEIEELEYGDWEAGEKGDGTFELDGQIQATESMMNNASIYLHVFFTKSGYSPDPRQRGKYAKKYTVSISKRINKFKKRRFQKTTNLLTGETEADPEMIKRAESEGPVEVLSHWHPNLTISLVHDHSPWKQGSVPSPLDKMIKFHPSGDYYPIVFINDYWNLNSEYQPINETTEELPFRLTYTPMGLFKLQFYAAQTMRNQWSALLGEDKGNEDEEEDGLKRAILETNPYLLGLTFAVSIVHSVFEFLAFKNDIQFWNSRKSMEGLSVRSVFFGVFQSLVVLLYILDNETNFVVKVSVFIGLLIDCWKITKVTNLQFDRESLILGFIPKLKFADKVSYTESSTKHYDKMAFKYLSWLLFPLLACFAVYSLFYQEHRGWYSWVLNMLYGFLLTFGFIMMTPQLFINYKMKSIAHLPWRMLTYKALNTFIDDIFAFVIKMPTLYRIGCLRDDVVFLIFLYQKYIYPTDYKRVNEFGTTGEMHAAVDPNAAVNGGATPSIEAADKSSQEKKDD
ncbi:cleft lip and palate transmembrane protein 1 homolog [Strongylocentrotus purpuratus]|uniref:Cleft lip and palate associated transmembrane protein n=1 Tax=Strongylocentrotus purpuratus TaxID=7668 RepID=A0A7M7HL08_STRPU|nr:cleft lip and palate transmembrane protein 1 homolog [Strongylocentrotus purpuratus]|eukprot:XP_011677134.1 PREDICTED: cleft lip and palate transmembrane protein 1 homolog [Strongylocentrotus purpuratus]